LFDSILGSLASHHVLTPVVRSVTSLVQSSTVYAVHVVTSQYAGSFYGTTAIRVFFGGEFSHHSAQKGNKTEVSLLQLLG